MPIYVVEINAILDVKFTQMMDQLPKFSSPPVIETVLSAQFSRLREFSNAHCGWFWKDYLEKDWATIKEVPRLSDQFERFGDQRQWSPYEGKLRIVQGPESERHQITHSNNEYMLQIQDSRFIYNWRKGDSEYPSYEQLLPEFNKYFAKFKNFTHDSGNGALEINQWEVTYVNHIPQGELWQSLQDLPKVIDKFTTLLGNLPLDGFSGEWNFVLGENIGRLYITLKHGRLNTEEGEEVIILQLTARGIVNEDTGIDLMKGFSIGHESIVKSFAAMTSKLAHEKWERST